MFLGVVCVLLVCFVDSIWGVAVLFPLVAIRLSSRIECLQLKHVRFRTLGLRGQVPRNELRFADIRNINSARCVIYLRISFGESLR